MDTLDEDTLKLVLNQLNPVEQLALSRVSSKFNRCSLKNSFIDLNNIPTTELINLVSKCPSLTTIKLPTVFDAVENENLLIQFLIQLASVNKNISNIYTNNGSIRADQWYHYIKTCCELDLAFDGSRIKYSFEENVANLITTEFTNLTGLKIKKIISPENVFEAVNLTGFKNCRLTGLEILYHDAVHDKIIEVVNFYATAGTVDTIKINLESGTESSKLFQLLSTIKKFKKLDLLIVTMSSAKNHWNEYNLNSLSNLLIVPTIKHLSIEFNTWTQFGKLFWTFIECPRHDFKSFTLFKYDLESRSRITYLGLDTAAATTRTMAIRTKTMSINLPLDLFIKKFKSSYRNFKFDSMADLIATAKILKPLIVGHKMRFNLFYAERRADGANSGKELIIKFSSEDIKNGLITIKI